MGPALGCACRNFIPGQSPGQDGPSDRPAGAVPATIAVLGGRPTIGLSDQQLEHMATAPGMIKLSDRDLPLAMAQGVDGATTVAATVTIAALAGIFVMATGGLGGVHRGARESWDISADLMALRREPVAVVAAGVKSVLVLALALFDHVVAGLGEDESTAQIWFEVEPFLLAPPLRLTGQSKMGAAARPLQ